MFGFFVSPFLVMLRSTLLSMFLMMTIVLIVSFLFLVSCVSLKKKVLVRWFLQRKNGNSFTFLVLFMMSLLEMLLLSVLVFVMPGLLMSMLFMATLLFRKQIKAGLCKDEQTRHLLFCIRVPRGTIHVSHRMLSHRPHQRTFSSFQTRLICELHVCLLLSGLS